MGSTNPTQAKIGLEWATVMFYFWGADAALKGRSSTLFYYFSETNLSTNSE
jgi:hypothetical protein